MRPRNLVSGEALSQPLMDDASWDKLFTTATLTIYQAEDVVSTAWAQAVGPGAQIMGSG